MFARHSNPIPESVRVDALLLRKRLWFFRETKLSPVPLQPSNEPIRFQRLNRLGGENPDSETARTRFDGQGMEAEPDQSRMPDNRGRFVSWRRGARIVPVHI